MYRPANLRKNPNDRFIPLRIPVDLNTDSPVSVIFSHSDLSKGDLFFNLAKKRYNHINYQNLLRESLLPFDIKVLNFYPPKKFTPYEFTSVEETWPVKPRRKPVIQAPDLILDMPNFDTYICHHVADWSSNNGLATIFQNEIHMWYPDSEVHRNCTNTKKRVINCVKWNNDGTQFAVGLLPNNLGLYDIVKEEMVCEISCCLSVCHFYSLEWIDDILITGCSRGVLSMVTNSFKFLRRVNHAHGSAIINIVKSCSNSYIASSGLDKSVVVWKMPDLEPHFQIDAPAVVRAIAWHPWKSALLAIGVNCERSRVIIWNVNTDQQVAYEKDIYKDSSIDCVTFNPISGELVVSHCGSCGADSNMVVSAISVFTNINKVVEELYIHRGIVPYLLWGNGGKLLASISSDENLCIWNFFGSSETNKGLQKKIKQNKKSKNFFCTIR